MQLRITVIDEVIDNRSLDKCINYLIYIYIILML